MKRYSILLVALALSLILCLGVFAAETEIATAEDLIKLSTDSTMWSGSYKLSADIDLGNVAFSPIGSAATPFSGTFDGDGHTISGLSVTAEPSAGLFGFVQEGTVKNLTVKGTVTSTFSATSAETKDGNDMVPGSGGICAMVYTGSTVENLTSYVTVNAPANSGGVIGIVNNLSEKLITVKNCVNYGTVNGTLGNIGCVIGRLRCESDSDSIAIIVDGCKNYADLDYHSEDRARFAGIAAYVRINSGTIEVKNCENHGNLSASNSKTDSNATMGGGIFGRIEVAKGQTACLTVNNCLNTGKITSTKHAGGIAGLFSRESGCVKNCSYFEGCKNTGTIIGDAYAGGLMGYAYPNSSVQLSYIKNCLNVGSVESVAVAGGLFGYLSGADLSNCVTLGTVTGTDTANEAIVGGLVGKTADGPAFTISDCYYLDSSAVAVASANVASDEKNNVAVASNAGKEIFTALDFTTTWTENNGKIDLAALAAGAVTSGVEIKMTIGTPTAYLNGTAEKLDAAPVIKNNRTMLPIRFVAESLGATVGWDGTTSTVTITSVEGKVIVFKIGEATYNDGNETKAFDTPSYIDAASGRTYLPVRAVAESLSAEVLWDGSTSTVTIIK